MITAYDIPFSPGDPTMWDEDPRTVWHALEEMATRQASDVDGPASSTDNGLVRWDGTTGKLIQDTATWTLTDAGELRSSVGTLDMALGKIQFAASPATTITGGPGNIDFELDGADRMNILDTQLTVRVPIVMQGGDRIDFDTLGKSSIRAGGSDTVLIEAGGTDAFKFTSTSFQIQQETRIDFDSDFDTSIRASGDDVLVFESGGVDVLTVLAAQLQVTQDIALTETKKLLLDADSDTSIRASADDTLVVEIAGLDEVTLTAALLTLGDGAAAYTIRLATELAGNAQDFTISGGLSGANSDGGKLILKPGEGQGLGSDGALEIQTASGVAAITMASGGLLTLNSTFVTTAGAFFGVPSITMDSGGFIGVNTGDAVVFTDNTSAVFTVNSVQALDITPTTLDGNSVLRLTNFAGMREVFSFAWPSSNTGTTRQGYVQGGVTWVTTSAKWGIRMPRAGSIIRIDAVMDINVIGTGDKLEARAWLDGAASGFAAELDPVTVANAIQFSATASVGTHTFTQGQVLTGTRVLTGTSPGQVTTDDWNISIEVEYD